MRHVSFIVSSKNAVAQRMNVPLSSTCRRSIDVLNPNGGTEGHAMH